ncbi:MAG: hypothetical protein K8T91_03285, partial [Planctomycetes bacterium]|nr:hypothetical protein [Planctomycetota bacterium]
MNPDRRQDELQELLGAMREGEATTAQHERLTALVAGDPHLAAHYVEYVQLCAQLQWQLGGLHGDASQQTRVEGRIGVILPPSASTPGPARSRRAGRPPAWFTRLGQPTLLAAAICVLVLVGVSIWTWTRPVPV